MSFLARDARATRARLLVAARREFAEYGIAGARVDRIAADAGSNKAQIYHSFGSKDGLFDAVFDGIVEQIVHGVPIDVNDLPGYAARLCDMYEKHPDILRLATWQRLERGGQMLPAAATATKEKVAAIKKAQAGGRLGDRYSAEVLLTAVLQIAALWSEANHEPISGGKALSAVARRRIVEQLVTDVLA